MQAQIQSTNFAFLVEHDPLLEKLASAAEDSFFRDPNTTLIKLRQLGEALAQHMASLLGIKFDEQTTQADLLYKLDREIGLDPVVRQLFHTLRIEGNKATHQFKTQHKEAKAGLLVAHKLAQWFHASSGKASKNFKPCSFQPLVDPSEQLSQLQSRIAQLEADQLETTSAASDQQLTKLIDQERSEYQQLLDLMDKESRIQAEQIKQTEAELERLAKESTEKIKALQQQLAQQEGKNATVKTKRSHIQPIVLDEALTRIIIDQQLSEAGWQADTQTLTYKKGARPEKGKNLAIAEWPTKTGPADYVLFAGLTPVGIVEAKKENTKVSGKVMQAERYSQGFTLSAPLIGAWQLCKRTVAWPDNNQGHYQIPFVYSCNGRPYVPQLAEQSGIWFRDVRHPSNTQRALSEFHTPEGLLDLLNRDKAAAEQKLADEPFGYLKLRDYQQKAIIAVENVLARDIRCALLAMATGTGKTRTIIGLIYRFLKAERFKRILFLVDRTALGDQALDSFKEAPLEQNQTLSKIYNIAELGDISAEAETRVQVATVQAMVKRIFMSDNPPAIDQFDCIIIDEAHRGYTLDQEMSEGEFATRDASQYLSSYRRVLDYFDAVKIGLTATPALHTKEIFGAPVFTYSYREAVADDWLIDHDAPIRYETLLSKKGIHFGKGEIVQVVDTQTGEVKPEELPDELNFEVESFNRGVITESFNCVICQQLALDLDPFGEEKTLIFCANDLHADMVKNLLDEAFKKLYGDEYNQAAVAKITSQSDKVGQLIARYKNERYPNIGITVDLLTTGIDVPRITNLVFMRRVKSRILYEQMLGRATRRCDEIGKIVFRIFDPVDIYAALEAVNTMKPLVKDPNVTIEQLTAELTNPELLEKALTIKGEQEGETHAHVVLSQLSQKVMRVLRKAEKSSEQRPEVKQKLNELQDLWNVEPKNLGKHLQNLGPEKASAFLQQHSGLINQLEEVKALIGSERRPIIYEGVDELISRTQTYGINEKPADYLDSFNQFIREQINQNAALSVVVKRPRDLTREQLKEIKLLLDEKGYSEAKLQSAVRNQTNQDIAASIVGHIRRAALGESLVPFEKRVEQGMERILQSHPWTMPQRNWLKRLAKQLVHEVIIDHEFVNQRFAENGGAKQLDKLLNQQLDKVLDELSEAIWQVG